MKNSAYLCTVPDSIEMTRDYFASLLRKFRHHHSVSIGFSKKHTEDIMKFRRSVGADSNTLPSNLYNFPVIWGTATTYIK